MSTSTTPKAAARRDRPHYLYIAVIVAVLAILVLGALLSVMMVRAMAERIRHRDELHVPVGGGRLARGAGPATAAADQLHIEHVAAGGLERRSGSRGDRGRGEQLPARSGHGKPSCERRWHEGGRADVTRAHGGAGEPRTATR